MRGNRGKGGAEMWLNCNECYTVGEQECGTHWPQVSAVADGPARRSVS